jgi:hypothetical protein
MLESNLEPDSGDSSTHTRSAVTKAILARRPDLDDTIRRLVGNSQSRERAQLLSLRGNEAVDVLDSLQSVSDVLFTTPLLPFITAHGSGWMQTCDMNIVEGSTKLLWTSQLLAMSFPVVFSSKMS